MARVQISKTEIISADAAVVLNEILIATQRNGCRLERVDGWELEVRRGSQLIMRTALNFASSEHFPVVAAIRVTPQHEGALLEISVLDDLGFGVRYGLTKKFKEAVEQLADLLVEAARIASKSTSISKATASGFCPSCGSPQVNGNVFCSDCGHKLLH